MRVPSIILVSISAAALAGCATTTPPQTNAAVLTPAPVYRPVAAAALAFDPPMALEQPLPDTSRDGRSPSAFVGYEDAVTNVYSVYQRDEIRSGPRGEFDRTAYTGRTSVTTR